MSKREFKSLYDYCIENNKQYLLNEWDYDKNGQVTPNNISYGSKKKMYWVCKYNHSWDAQITSRINGNGCPYCSGRYATKENNLAIKNPQLAKEWHPTKNGMLTPYDVTVNSNKKVWWLCYENPTHEWNTTINNRINGNGCPYCSGRYATKKNNLAIKNPQLASEWHPTKNGTLTPYDVTVNSGKKVWWICNQSHEWNARIDSRNRGSNCPHCNKENRTSFPEQAIYYYVKQIFPDAINSYKPQWLKPMEIDIFIPSLNIGIEYDGCMFHTKKQIKRDERKNRILKENNIILIRIREENCANIHMLERQFLIEIKDIYNSNYSTLREYLLNLFSLLNRILNNPIKNIPDINIEKDKNVIYSLFAERDKKNSFTNKHPELLKYWNYDKNNILKPNMISFGSNKKIWWKCDKGHEWSSKVNNISNGIGCPYCSGKKVCLDNCLTTINPQLASEWHPTKNGRLTPYDVTANSGKKVWWICSKQHEWDSCISNRNKNIGCPYCSGRYATKENNLAVKNPQLAKEWHPTKNGTLTPYDVTPNSHKKVWWACTICGHEYEKTVDRQTNKNKTIRCPKCKHIIKEKE